MAAVFVPRQLSDLTGVLTVAAGGTGQTTAALAINALVPTQTSNSGKVLGTDGSVVSWVSASGTGTVTSVALTTPSWLSVAGSPVTTTGTLAVTATAGQTANLVLATPNGSTGAVGLRALVAADIPAIAESQVTNLVADLAAKATDSLVVHLAGTETVSGAKTFSSQIIGSVSGNAANVTGTVALANGGTGQTTASAAVNALVPTQTSNSGKVLGTNGTAVSWVSAGVTTLTGTANQVVASASTGGVTLSLPQSIDTAAAPQFASIGCGIAADTSGAVPAYFYGTGGTNRVVVDGVSSNVGFRLRSGGVNKWSNAIYPYYSSAHSYVFYNDVSGAASLFIDANFGKLDLGLTGDPAAEPPAQLTVRNRDGGSPGVQVRAAASQTVDLAQFTNSTGATVVSGVEKGGALFVATGSGAPATTPKDGTLYLDTTNNKLYARTGAAWKSVTLT